MKARRKPKPARKRPALSPLRRDPTRLGGVRRAMGAEVRRRFARLRLEVINLVWRDDAFGLDGRDPFAVNSFCPTGHGGGIDPTCKPKAGGPATGGKSPAGAGIEVTVKGAGSLDVVFGKGRLTPEGAARAAGAIGGSHATLTVHADRVEVMVTHAGYSAARVLYRDHIVNAFLSVGETGKGLGTRILASQVEHAARSGFSHLETRAERGKNLNGYWTWARLGYDGQLPAGARPPARERTVSDLMRTPAGRGWWKEHGDTFRGRFDLAEGSTSRRVLAAYVAQRGPTGNGVVANVSAEEIELTAADEAILDRIWDRIDVDIALNAFCATGYGGGIDPTCRAGGHGANILGALRAVGATASHAEHVVKAYVADRIAAAVARLPAPVQAGVRLAYAAARAGTRAAFVTWTAGQAFAERVARERGYTPEQARRLRGVLATADVVAFKPIGVGLGATGVGGGAALGASLIPPATAGYLAYSTARNPMATYRAAVGVVRDTAHRIATLNVDERERLLAALEKHAFSDWYIALLHAAMPESASLEQAIRLADAAYARRPTDPTGVVANNRWAFSAMPDKVRAFLAWLDEAISRLIFTPDWWTPFVRRAFIRGLGRAYDDVRGSSLSEPVGFAGGRAEFLRTITGQPFGIVANAARVTSQFRGAGGKFVTEKVHLLAVRLENELRGATAAMAQKVAREVSEGLANGWSARAVAVNIGKAIDSIGEARSLLIAQTELTRAHAEAQLDAMEAMGEGEVSVQAEWLTRAGACELCAPMSGVILPIEKARGMIPRHPRCRCIYTAVEKPPSERVELRRAVRASRKAEGVKDAWPEAISLVGNVSPELAAFSRFLSR
jgi:hypothetical protein